MAKRRKTGKRSGFGFQKLEPKQLMAGDLVSANLSADWFFEEPVAQQQTARTAENTVSKQDWGGQQTEVKSGEWLIQLADNTLQDNSIATVVEEIQSEMPHVDVIGGTGRIGQLHVRSSLGFDQAQRAFATSPAISAHEPVQILTIAGLDQGSSNSDLSNQQWALDKINAPEAWDAGFDDTGIVVAVIDTGVDYQHSDLQHNMWRNPGEIAGNGIDDDGNGFTDDIFGVDFANGDSDPHDDANHGTHVAGIIAADRSNNVGIVGVSQANIMAVKFLGADGRGSLDNALKSINYTNLMRATYGINIRVANHSWGGAFASEALENAFAQSEAVGILSVVSAGNESENNDSYTYSPANVDVDSVITVAATDQSDRLAGFSSYGTQSVDLSAPGVGIVSTVRGGGYQSFNGTSMAAPQVAGAAAIMFAAQPDLGLFEAKQALMETADTVQQGYTISDGRLNVASALNAVRPLELDGRVTIVDGVLSAPADNFSMPLNQVGDRVVTVNDGAIYIHANQRQNVRATDVGENVRFELSGVGASISATFASLSEVTFLGSQFDDVFINRSVNLDSTVRGNNGDDRILVVSGTNNLGGGNGADRIEGGLGNDFIHGGAGHDVLFGNGGDDYVVGKSGNDWIFGGIGNDTLLGGEGNDPIYGGSGDDRLDGNQGNDILRGGDGNDRVYGNEGHDSLFGDAGNDKLYGHAGNDWMTGGIGDDFLRGNEGDDVLYGDLGNDRILGDAGRDQLFGQAGNDRLEGGTGDDSMFGGLGDDYLRGHEGNDLLDGGEGKNRLRGDSGADRFTVIYANHMDNLIEDHEWWNFEWIDWI
ncbi:S8 family serine peptidase [Mariniblastus fucicola]|uniref:Thermophilic serine proteinase n=1 Tax=Mariniblastus fucicola TaxID=980251 RepID=A0A5B9PDC9_9BACT|nr:S8 family serine peptidase [Mariniblastus fucicola]QEG21033.1 Thermophilic serine proteinase precursor [Mariniblastus fucicola]